MVQCNVGVCVKLKLDLPFLKVIDDRKSCFLRLFLLKLVPRRTQHFKNHIVCHF